MMYEIDVTLKMIYYETPESDVIKIHRPSTNRTFSRILFFSETSRFPCSVFTCDINNDVSSFAFNPPGEVDSPVHLS